MAKEIKAMYFRYSFNSVLSFLSKYVGQIELTITLFALCYKSRTLYSIPVPDASATMHKSKSDTSHGSSLKRGVVKRWKSFKVLVFVDFFK